MKKIITIAAILVCSFLAAAPIVTRADVLSPKAMMQETTDQIVDIVQKNKGDANATKRRELLRQVINPQFDFAKMAQLSLGTNWNTITAEEQQEYVKVFSDLLAKTYLTKVETVEPGMVSIEAERIEEGNQKASVKTLVKSKGDFFPIDYRFVRDSQTAPWRVYDVVIENIGLVVNYRNEFASIIRKDTFSGLMEQLRKKAADK